jgi:ATP-binding cassette, subfamily B, bacterial
VTASGRREGWRLLRATLAAQKRGIALGGLVGLLWSGTKIAVPLLVGAAINQAVDGHGSLLAWSLTIVVIGLVAGILSASRRYLAFREARLTERWLRERLFAHLQALHIGFHDRAQTGQLMSRASNDLQQVQAFVVMIPLTMSNLALVVGVAAVLLAMNPLLALCALVPLPIVNVLAKRFSAHIHPAVLAVQAEAAEVATVVEETVAGVRVVKGFGAEPVQLAKFTREAEDVRTASLRAAGIRRHYLPAIDLMPSVGLILVLGVGGHLVAQGSLSIGGLVAFNAYVALLVWPLRTIGMTVSWAQRAAAALERVHEVLSTEPIVTDPPHPKALPARSAAQRTGGVRFADVRFGYDHAHPVLDGFDLVIEPGSSIALVGATGSGKSTVARLLARFYDVDAGAIELDGIDLRRLRVHDLRGAVGIVFEDTLLFHDTVAANIAFADPDASFERIERAAALAGATEFVHDLPHGYDTLLGERGFSLSGGQRQRIAIARAILADPRVLVLDDATSAVDPSKEHEIRDALATVMAERSTIVIAHRPATIALAERVVLLDRGQVEAVGTHQELLAESVRYGEVLAAWAASDAERDAAVATAGDGGGDEARGDAERAADVGADVGAVA